MVRSTICLLLWALTLLPRANSVDTHIGGLRVIHTGDAAYWDTGVLNYFARWSKSYNMFAGKGLDQPRGHLVKFDADFKPDDDADDQSGAFSFVSVYGETVEPRAVFRIVESYTGSNPAKQRSFQPQGEVEADGSFYDLYSVWHGSGTPDNGEPYFELWSVRRTQRTECLVSVNEHSRAWAGRGILLGTHTHRLVTTESQASAGQCTIAIDTI